MDELYKKINKILEIKFPDKEERDSILEKAGEIMILETLNESLERLPGHAQRLKLSNLIKTGDLGEAFDYAEKNGVAMENIFEEVAKSVVADMFM